jgi:dTDP-4-dehydrorhamnose reductase
MKVLLTGASGLLGAALLLHAPRATSIAAQTRTRRLPPLLRAKAQDEVIMDLTDESAVTSLLDEEVFGLVIHSAARTDAGLCERDAAGAVQDNLQVPKTLLALCEKRNMVLIHISTDLVFDGLAPPYGEESPPSPLGVYGRTKADAEALLLGYPQALVVRLPLLLGPSPSGRRSAGEALALALGRGEKACLFADEFRSPIHAWTVAKIIWRLIGLGARGLVQVAGKERISRWELGLALAERMGLPKERLKRGLLRDFKGAPPRPPDLTLRVIRMEGLTGWKAPALQDDLLLPQTRAEWLG